LRGVEFVGFAVKIPILSDRAGTEKYSGKGIDSLQSRGKHGRAPFSHCMFEERLQDLSTRLSAAKDDEEALAIVAELRDLVHERIQQLRGGLSLAFASKLPPLDEEPPKKIA
jgi:hypothetical protein